MIRRRSNFSALARGLSYIFRLGCRFSRRFGVNKVGDYLMNDVSWDSAQTQRLLQRAQTGDRQAFEELFARHRLYLRQLVELRELCRSQRAGTLTSKTTTSSTRPPWRLMVWSKARASVQFGQFG